MRCALAWVLVKPHNLADHFGDWLMTLAATGPQAMRHPNPHNRGLQIAQCPAPSNAWTIALRLLGCLPRSWRPLARRRRPRPSGEPLGGGDQRGRPAGVG